MKTLSKIMEGTYLDIWYEIDEINSSDIYRSAIFPDKQSLKNICKINPMPLVCAIIKNSESELTKEFKRMTNAQIIALHKSGESQTLKEIVNLVIQWVLHEFEDELSFEPRIGGSFNSTSVYNFSQ